VSSEEKASESNCESSPLPWRPWVPRVIGEFWSGIALVSALALMQAYCWGLFLFFDKRVDNALFIVLFAIKRFPANSSTRAFIGLGGKEK
jgi:hypothetical protein